MKLSRSRLRKIILEEAKDVSEGLGFGKFSPWGSKSTISKRAQLNKHGEEDEYERRFYIVITEPDGDRRRHTYSGYTDEQAWEEAARIKRDGDYPAGSEFDIYEDAIEGDRYIGAIAGFGRDDDEMFTETLKIKKSDVARIIREELNEHFEGSARHPHPHPEEDDDQDFATVSDEEFAADSQAAYDQMEQGYSDDPESIDAEVDSPDLEDPEDPQEAPDGEDPIDLWHELGDLITDPDLSLYEKLGPEKYKSIVPIAREYRMMKLREAYGRFFRLVGRAPEQGADYDPESGQMKPRYAWSNEYNLFPAQVRSLFNGDTGNLDSSQASKMAARKKELMPLFKKVDATEGSDSRYGRRRHSIIHIESGTQVDGGVNKQGSLGT
jgi:hypothetical protein